LLQTRLVLGEQIGRDQFILAGEVIIERAFCHPGLFGNSIYTHAADALGIKQLGGNVDDVLSRGAL